MFQTVDVLDSGCFRQLMFQTVDVLDSGCFRQLMFQTDDVFEIDVLVDEVLELDVLGACIWNIPLLVLVVSIDTFIISITFY